MPLSPGTCLGSYEIRALLGSGGMGEVYRAFDPRLGRDVALKVIPAAPSGDRERPRRFRVEALALGALSHPHVVQVHDAGEAGGFLFLVMEYLEGETLGARLARGPMPWRQAAGILAAVAGGLEAAHARGILHRDLKAENVFLTADGQVKILDFGLAKLALSQWGPAGTSTLAGTLLGTLPSMSPEQALGLPADARSDVFGAGALLHELITGRAPFRRETSPETLAAILRDPPPPFGRHHPVPGDLERIVGRCLEKDPDARFQTAGELAASLESLLASHPDAHPGWRAPGLRRAGWALGTAGVLVAGAAWWGQAPARTPGPTPPCVILGQGGSGSADPAWEAFARRASEALSEDLGPFLRPVVTSGGVEAARQVARRRNARFLAIVEVDRVAGRAEAMVRLLDPGREGEVHVLGPWEVDGGGEARALEDLRQVAGGAIAWSCDPTWCPPPGATRPPRLDAYRAFQQGWRDLPTNPGPGLALLERSAALDPAFTLGRLMLAAALADQARHGEAQEVLAAVEAEYDRLTPLEQTLARGERARLEGRLANVLACAEEARQLGFEAVPAHLAWARVELAVNAPHLALQRLRRLPPGAAGLPGAWLRCAALHRLGEFGAEWRAAREIRSALPDRPEGWCAEAGALACLGRLAELQATLADLAGRGAPRTLLPQVQAHAAAVLHARGEQRASRRHAEAALASFQALPDADQAGLWRPIARTYMILGRYAEGRAYLRETRRCGGGGPAWLGADGCLAAWAGQGNDAREADRRLAAEDGPPSFGEAAFQRACIAAALGEKGRALDLLRQAIAQGKGFDPGFREEPGLRALQGDEAFERFMSWIP